MFFGPKFHDESIGDIICRVARFLRHLEAKAYFWCHWPKSWRSYCREAKHWSPHKPYTSSRFCFMKNKKCQTSRDSCEILHFWHHHRILREKMVENIEGSVLIASTSTGLQKLQGLVTSHLIRRDITMCIGQRDHIFSFSQTNHMFDIFTALISNHPRCTHGLAELWCWKSANAFLRRHACIKVMGCRSL